MCSAWTVPLRPLEIQSFQKEVYPSLSLSPKSKTSGLKPWFKKSGYYDDDDGYHNSDPFCCRRNLRFNGSFWSGRGRRPSAHYQPLSFSSCWKPDKTTGSGRVPPAHDQPLSFWDDDWLNIAQCRVRRAAITFLGPRCSLPTFEFFILVEILEKVVYFRDRFWNPPRGAG